jgi:integrase
MTVSATSQPYSHRSSTSNAAQPRHLHRRGETYYFKRKIPRDVRAAFPDAQGDTLWKTLNTTLLQRAKIMLAVEVGQFDEVVAKARLTNARTNAAALSSSQKFAANSADAAKSATKLSGKGLPVPTTVAPALFTPVTVLASPAMYSGQPARRVEAATTQYSLMHLFEFWKATQSRQRTMNAVKKVVLAFQDLHGRLPCNEVTRQHVRAYRDALLEARLSEGTILNRLGFLSTLWRFGQVELIEDIVYNPFERIPVVGAQPARVEKERRAFAVSELNLVFQSELYTARKFPKGQVGEAAYWVPLMGPFVGGRIEEVAQLRVADIERVNGQWCIRICDLGEDQSIKTVSSYRRVPVHAELVKCGFLAYVAAQAKAGHDRVFPSLRNNNAHRIWSNALGKWYARFLDTVSLSDIRLDFHSNRYTFRQQCSLCGIENEVRDALTGHWASNRDAGRVYMRAEERQYPFPKLVTAMAMLRYDELRISHLYVNEPYRDVELLLR